MNKQSISLCMIVKNEEKHLNKCLESVKEIVDEIIIVDTGSSDGTLEIAKEYNAKIYHFEWVDSFAAARNYSIKQASSDYILHLDADEYIEPGADIQKDMESGKDYYLMKIKNSISTGGAFTHTAVRLFKNNKNFYYQNRLHEQLNIHDEVNEFTSGEANSIIHHVGYSNDIMIEKNKADRNLPLMLKEVEENPTGYNLYNMGKAYIAKDNYAEALPYFTRAYPLSRDRIYLGELLAKMSLCLLELQRHEEGLQILKDAVELLPLDADLRYTQARIFYEWGYLKDAEISLKKCLEIGDKGVLVTEGSGGYRAQLMLAELYEKQGDLLKSFNEVTKVLKQKKTFVPNIVKYLNIMLQTNIPMEDVYSNLKSLYNIVSVDELTSLLEVLYNLRHPLLYRYILDYKLNVESHVLAVAKQYAKSYEDAREEWYSLSQIEDENVTDIVLLSFVLGDKELLSVRKSLLNLSNKDWKVLNKIVIKDNVEEKISEEIEKILLKLSTHLIVLQEFDHFEYISKLLLKGSANIVFELSKTLYDYGYNDVSVDFLLANMDRHPTHIKTIELLGDICLRNNNDQDALVLYNRLLNFKKDYPTYERLYNLYEKMNDKEGMNKIRQQIEALFPLCNWV
ncbi:MULTISPECIES: glycosyltransferase [unclassified Paenibacillus]|uniref:glycosyltransferase n=1 Tax=unclassified Paenibacillus TaxID=185978 RepID=UPI001AE102B3|nr:MULTISPECIES: glycosyltransferase [unclassified Paenibacillus]MBP1157800.1 glycosyltransferase involved in cell wall biosynthesis [Paenibacillus sp. PvP091]MBP1171464.1 glycosyltransferase involved in cell wall biosynthesis [Paenibacillus sp. PvR098]MBP2442492.1 glycosyltransferase involved in cell wall biosynthesis [Paenibacillus sp. PvP052]